MKNKKTVISISVFTSLLIAINIITNILIYKEYNRNYNNKLNSIILTIKDKYPNITDNEIMDIINSDTNRSYFSKYNIDINKDTIIKDNNKVFIINIIITIILIFLSITIYIIIFIKYNKSIDKEINKLTKLIKEINNKNYKIDIEDYSETKLSKLKSEIYKTTIMLKEESINSFKDKENLKTSLEDISHQLKTPLTSISINLDNLIDDTNMDNKTRLEFLIDIKKEIYNINFLVQALLKLSRIDTNTVVLNNDYISVNNVVLESINKLSCLSDLNNIFINFKNDKDIYIYGDFIWQVEAISNILKDSIEHSYSNGIIDISINDTPTYKEIIIKDYGTGISDVDLPHIFERFYKGSNSSSDSIGIGLALAKSIVEKSNGKIMVDSIINKGTIFKVRYYL